MTKVESLWGEEFPLEETPLQNKEIIKKVAKKKEVKVSSATSVLKSKKISVEDKVALVTEDVNRILGVYKSSTQTIKSYDEFERYIDACISNGIVSIDTETNNTLNTFDCLIMGLCLYTPGQKNAYIPVHHVNNNGDRWPWQITEDQIHTQMQRILDNNVFEIYHNAVFDIEVIKQTCGIKLKADWDTQVGAQMIDENEEKKLKVQYKLHINPEQDKYDIEHLFKGLPYSIFDPELFALYAATDAYETYKLYEYQKNILEKPENADVYNLFKTIEIPILDVVVDMELEGIEVDLDYAKRLSKVYHEKLDEIKVKVNDELNRLKPTIDAWRQTKEANTPTVGRTGKPGKTKNQQLLDPPELSSPTQMAILLYDVLKAPVVDKKNPRGTGEDILKGLSKNIPLCKLLDDKRGYDILIDTFIDKIPEVVQKDGRVHARFNTCGAKTGRFSSSDPNL